MTIASEKTAVKNVNKVILLKQVIFKCVIRRLV